MQAQAYRVDRDPVVQDLTLWELHEIPKHRVLLQAGPCPLATLPHGASQRLGQLPSRAALDDLLLPELLQLDVPADEVRVVIVDLIVRPLDGVGD